MRCHIEILGVHSRLTSPSLLLSFEKQNYLFNCGQNLSRSLTYSNFRNKIENVFLTGINLDTISSLPTLMSYLVLDSRESYRRVVHGPVGIKEYTNFSRNTIYDVIEYGNKEASNLQAAEDNYNDENVKIKVLSFNPRNYNGLDTSESWNSCASYIVQCKKPRRKFLLEKAAELGIPQGKLYGELARGNSIAIDGKTINPDDVLGPPTKSPVFGVIYMPSTNYLLSDVSRTISSYLTNENDFDYIFHMSPESVLLHSNYHQFLDSLPPHINHVVFSKSLAPLLKNTLISPIFPYSDDLLIKESQIFPKYFKVSTEMYGDINTNNADYIKILFKKLVVPRLGMRIHLNPSEVKGKIETNDSLCSLDINKINDEMKKIVLPKQANRINNIPYNSLVNTKIKGSDPSVLILGTSSARADQFRNVSSVWVGDFGSSFLFDCGEGTYGQLCRHFGKNIDKALIDLKTIFISHLHSDHQQGISKIIHERSKLTSDPINIVSIGTLRYDLEAFKSIFSPFNFKFFTYNSRYPDIPGIELIKLVPTEHSVKSNAIIIKHKSGWKIVYSGDTRPCKDLITEGKDATLLIHESTFIDGDEKAAKKYKHSTIGEAIEIGGKMNAWRILLTHFSRRYPDWFDENKDYKAIIAFDLMKFKLSESYKVEQDMRKILKIYKETRRNIFVNNPLSSEEEEEE